MRSTFTIADIYSTPARARVLRALALTDGPLSIRSVATHAGISHTAAGVVLGQLEAMGLVRGHRVGVAHAYSLERANVFVRDMVLQAVEAERTIIDELRHDLVSDFAEHAESLILFGSFAHGEQTAGSDIDVFALATDARREQLLRDRNLERWHWYRTKYSAPLSLMVLSRSQSADAFAWDQNEFRTELASTGIVLHGLAVDEWGLDPDFSR